MGISVSVIRVPLEPAVDVLSRRASLSDFAEYLDFELVPYDPDAGEREDLDPTSPEIRLWRSYGLVLDVLTETAHEHHSSLFITDEFADPLAWAAFGARLPKWEGDRLLRYSLGSDLDAICSALEAIDGQELERRVWRVLRLAPQYEPEGCEPWVQNRMEDIVPALQGLFQRARSAGEIVIHQRF
ncbi:MAG: hypothetical protein AAGI91_10825 [Bacteroidota bacterium]